MIDPISLSSNAVNQIIHSEKFGVKCAKFFIGSVKNTDSTPDITRWTKHCGIVAMVIGASMVVVAAGLMAGFSFLLIPTAVFMAFGVAAFLYGAVLTVIGNIGKVDEPIENSLENPYAKDAADVDGQESISYFENLEDTGVDKLSKYKNDVGEITKESSEKIKKNKIIEFDQNRLTRKIPKVIYHFWSGDRCSLNLFVENLNKLKHLNPSYEVVIYLLPTSEYSSLEQDYDIIVNSEGNFKIRDLRDEEWFKEKFSKTIEYSLFKELIWGHKPFQAAAADILKAHIINENGGVWNDIDNIPMAPFPEQIDTVEEGKIYTSSKVKFDDIFNVTNDEGTLFCTFATHNDNKVLQSIINEMRKNISNGDFRFISEEKREHAFHASIANLVGTALYTKTYRRLSAGYSNDIDNNPFSFSAFEVDNNTCSKYSILGKSIHPNFSSF